MEIQNKIKIAVEKLYLEEGVQAINITNIAKIAKIAKKTIYTVYNNKQTIVENLTKLSIQTHKRENDKMLLDATLAIEIRLDFVIAHDLDLILSLDPGDLNEMRKRFHSSWLILMKYLNEEMKEKYEFIINNLTLSKQLEPNTKSISILAKIIVNYMLCTLEIKQRSYTPDFTLLKQTVNRFIFNSIITSPQNSRTPKK